MKRFIKTETIKELGKYFLDVSKIIIGLAIVSPFLKLGTISNAALFSTGILFIMGVVLTNIGVKDE